MFCEKGVLRNFAKFTGKHLCQSLFFSIKLQASVCNFIIKEALAQVFSCEFCEISQNIFSHRTAPVAASVFRILLILNLSFKIILTSKESSENATSSFPIFFIILIDIQRMVTIIPQATIPHKIIETFYVLT